MTVPMHLRHKISVLSHCDLAPFLSKWGGNNSISWRHRQYIQRYFLDGHTIVPKIFCISTSQFILTLFATHVNPHEPSPVVGRVHLRLWILIVPRHTSSGLHSHFLFLSTCTSYQRVADVTFYHLLVSYLMTRPIFLLTFLGTIWILANCTVIDSRLGAKGALHFPLVGSF